VRFCPQCGAPIVSGARFCVECGENLAAVNSPSDPSSASTTPSSSAPAPRAPSPISTASAASIPPFEAPPTAIGTLAPFAAVFGGILAIGVVVTILIMRQMPAQPTVQPSAPPPARNTGDSDSRGFPPGHPTVQIPKEALDFINRVTQKAQANSNDLAAWDQLGDVTLRAAAFDPSYYPRAADAFAHVLKLDPENLDALRGMGNIDFDQRKFDQAIAAYEHYLAKKPDDPDVRTDLGTMYLSTSNADQAVSQYRKVLALHPQFFEAAFNLGVAYSQMNQPADAQTALRAALKIAPDADARTRVNQMLASLATAPPASSGTATASSAPPPVASSNPPMAVGTFQQSMEQMLRGLPIAGPKVASLQWPSPTKTRVLMDNFPMDQMPPFAANKFMTDLKAGIDQVKTAHQVSGQVEVDICDAASGRVMQTVTE
jgi:cytochrome c-type biogenesis protein CcmH/NrfG